MQPPAPPPPPGPEAAAPDLLEAVRALVTPERLLRDPRATGAGVSVCIIDSGMDESLLRARHAELLPIRGGLFRPGAAEPLPYDGRQSTPHGTTVADIILTLAPRVKLYSADVFGPTGSCEVETVIAALRHAIDVWNVKVSAKLAVGTMASSRPG